MENKKNLLLILQCEKIKQRFIIFSNKKKESKFQSHSAILQQPKKCTKMN